MPGRAARAAAPCIYPQRPALRYTALSRMVNAQPLTSAVTAGNVSSVASGRRRLFAIDGTVLQAAHVARSASARLVLMAAIAGACGRSVPLPPPAADGRCIQQCQANHAVCLQAANPGAGGYGDARAALVGGLISMAVASSARGQCSDVLKDCYATCGQPMTPQEQQERAVAELCYQLRCADGRAGGWIGKAGTLGREVAVAIQLCRTGETQIVGQWACAPIMAGFGCVTAGGPVRGVVQNNALQLVSEPLPGGVVSRCDFTARPTADSRLEGTYVCAGSTRVEGGFIVSACGDALSAGRQIPPHIESDGELGGHGVMDFGDK